MLCDAAEHVALEAAPTPRPGDRGRHRTHGGRPPAARAPAPSAANSAHSGLRPDVPRPLRRIHARLGVDQRPR